MAEPRRGQPIAAGAAFQRTRNAADGGDADRGAVVDVTVRRAGQQQRHNPPAVSQRFELGRGAQVLKERAHFSGILQAAQSLP